MACRVRLAIIHSAPSQSLQDWLHPTLLQLQSGLGLVHVSPPAFCRSLIGYLQPAPPSQVIGLGPNFLLNPYLDPLEWSHEGWPRPYRAGFSTSLLRVQIHSTPIETGSTLFIRASAIVSEALPSAGPHMPPNAVSRHTCWHLTSATSQSTRINTNPPSQARRHVAGRLVVP